MQFKGPERGCPEPVFPSVDFKAEPEQGGLAVGFHPGNPYDSETGLLSRPRLDSSSSFDFVNGEPTDDTYRKRLDSMSPHEARQYGERILGIVRHSQGLVDHA